MLFKKLSEQYTHIFVYYTTNTRMCELSIYVTINVVEKFSNFLVKGSKIGKYFISAITKKRFHNNINHD